MRNVVSLGAALTLLAPAACIQQLPGDGFTSIDLGSGRRIHGRVMSFKELRDRNVVRQRTDYSCGAAALATLLSFGLDDPTGELVVLKLLIEALPPDEEALRKKEGFSLLDLQRVAQGLGYRAQGFRLEPRFLEKLERPVIVFIEPEGYGHFAVLKGIREGRAYLADPSLGNKRMPLHHFLAMWTRPDGNGIVFVVERPDGSWPDDAPLAIGEPSIEGERLSARELLRIGPRGLDAAGLGQ